MFLTWLKARTYVIKYVRDTARETRLDAISASLFYGVKRFGVPAVRNVRRTESRARARKPGVVINDCGAASNSGVYPVCMIQNK